MSSLRGICVVLARVLAAAGGDHGEEPGRLLAFVLEMMGQVGVEGDAVSLAQLVAGPVDDQRQGAGEDHRGLTAAGLVHRRVLAAAGGGAGLEHVQGDVGALAGQRRRQLLEAMAATLERAARAGTADRDVLPSSRRSS